MAGRFRNVTGSLNALLVLEAAVRHANFTRAGKELSLSQPTISRHIATLEARIRQPLFDRSNNRIQPTAAGRRLAEAVSLGLGHTETAWEGLSRSAHQSDLVLACTFGFADNWLMPRFTGLKNALGDKRLRIATSDWMDCLDMERIDIAVVWDLSHAPDRPHIPLFAEEAFPVCSPGYLRQRPDIAARPEALAEAELLHFDVGRSGFLTWRLWFAGLGIDYRARPGAYQYDAFPFVLKAALDGEGVALGWRYLVDRMLDEGSLVRVGQSVVNRETAYYLQYRRGGPHRESIRTIIDWFRQTVEKQKRTI